MARKKVEWKEGDVFAIPIQGSAKFSIGQILDNPRINLIRIAIFNELIDQNLDVNLENMCLKSNLISTVQCTREQLDFNVWKVLGNKSSRPIPVTDYPNEQFRSNAWIGASTYDAALVEDFVSAFHGYIYWDDWHDPNFLDEFLINLSKKPINLKYKKE